MVLYISVGSWSIQWCTRLIPSIYAIWQNIGRSLNLPRRWLAALAQRTLHVAAGTVKLVRHDIAAIFRPESLLTAVNLASLQGWGSLRSMRLSPGPAHRRTTGARSCILGCYLRGFSNVQALKLLRVLSSGARLRSVQVPFCFPCVVQAWFELHFH